MEVPPLLTERSTTTAAAISSIAYQHSHFEKQWLKDKLDELLIQGFNRLYTGPWVFPLVLVKKPEVPVVQMHGVSVWTSESSMTVLQCSH